MDTRNANFCEFANMFKPKKERFDFNLIFLIVASGLWAGAGRASAAPASLVWYQATLIFL